jgi:hypothetical protein
MRGRFRKSLSAIALLASASPALAIITQDSAANGHDLAPDPLDLSRYVGQLGSFTATPISARYFVTANHIGQAYTSFDYANGTSRTTTYAITYVATMDDLAVWKISDFDPDSFSLTAPIYTQSTEVNQPMVALGRGTLRGTPVTVNNTLRGWQWGDSTTDLTWGNNTVAGVVDGTNAGLPGDLLTFEFSNNGDPHTGSLSGGDSGGAVFVLDPVDHTYKMAATNSAVDGPFATAPGGPYFEAALLDARGFYVGSPTNNFFIDPATNPNPVPSSSYATRLSSRLAFIKSTIGLSTISAWTSPAGGDWNLAANWNGASPSGTTAEADFFAANSASQIVFTNTQIVLAALHFNSANSYLINGTGSLTLQSATGPALLQVEQGTQTISVPVSVAGPALVHLSPGATLAMNQLMLASGAAMTIASHGATPGGTIKVQSLTLRAGAKFDLTDNTLTITDDSAGSLANIRSLLVRGFNAGSWDGDGINSSTAHFDASLKTALGYIDRNNMITIKYTFYGDNNLDGVVNTMDFQMFLDGFVATSASSWAQGDYTYDGTVDLGNDFNLFLNSYLTQGGALGDLAPIILSQNDLSSTQKSELLSVVPEPTSVVVLSALTIPLLRRRRKTSCHSLSLQGRGQG